MASEFQNGPDQILPAEDSTTTSPDVPVRLRIPETGKAIETTPPVSIPGLLKRTATDFPDHPALAYKAEGKWNKITYKEYYELVRTCAKAFIKLGLERHHAVCILGFNSPEWFISDLAAIFAGGIAVGIYTTNSSEACFHCANHSRANIIVVQDQKQLEKILAIKSRLPHLKAIIQYEGTPTSADVISWEDLLIIGRDQEDEDLERVLKTIGVNECCTLVYTSGTVGKPKAVMLSHDNLTWDALSICERLDVKKGEEVIVSYLPLSHVAAQVTDIYIAMMYAVCIYFADANALKGSLINTLQEAQPTKFLGVPRVWEKMHEKMMQVAAQNGRVKKSLASWAKSQALHYHLNRIKGYVGTNSTISPMLGFRVNGSGWGYCLASSLIFKKVKQALGLSRCTLFVSAAAPLAADIKRYFLSIDMPIMEAFGMSEASGAHTMCNMGSFGLETIGMALPGMKTKILNPEDGQGEICMNGRHVFMGYLGDREKTDEAIDSEGWLHSGDLGRIDENNFIYITGRLKELIITAGGENIPPVPIEQLVKSELPHVSNVFLVGDKRKFLSVLLTFKTDVDSDTARPLDTLLPSVQDWLKSLGCPAKTVTEVLEAGPHPKLLEALKESIDRVNQQAVSNAQRIQKLSILPVDFSVATGELGPTMKVKRNVVAAKYADIIEKMYA
ncbi:very long-chain-fatty-acid--CoA ligase bubblegum isoform X2 [Tribolium castaneum]|nr:PREDICTED: very long-chain-fatty-acid--CoA ligase bubblegum isoform X1 [Tribolium castaneum]XP_008200674.1 PREDICTED: very long-chain-fatty-acid--CoA ligase bubblegum isoform X1 [Tribolium castaneum]XP_008200675.1 PREDICTED: very long-chain-fatty-acid--CoA ligase bubblegum isoform X1 [Tribolium castaneum]XP_015834621.1 PREDICTED: very long-chain-fatty-acid--CoA ligase bubblegum isoform X1 [Tribolium castaneum]|eukprot:XP_008200673.1 PREDICTED: very long-chain-fatty-acid--CoA ligase bubblegum isoform X1 [Tribolium castaneum]